MSYHFFLTLNQNETEMKDLKFQRCSKITKITSHQRVFNFSRVPSKVAQIGALKFTKLSKKIFFQSLQERASKDCNTVDPV